MDVEVSPDVHRHLWETGQKLADINPVGLWLMLEMGAIQLKKTQRNYAILSEWPPKGL